MTYIIAGTLVTLILVAGVVWFIIEATKKVIPAAFAAYPPYPSQNVQPASYRVPRPIG